MKKVNAVTASILWMREEKGGRCCITIELVNFANEFANKFFFLSNQNRGFLRAGIIYPIHHFISGV